MSVRASVSRTAQIGIVIARIRNTRRLICFKIASSLVVCMAFMPWTSVCSIHRLEFPRIFIQIEFYRFHKIYLAALMTI